MVLKVELPRPSWDTVSVVVAMAVIGKRHMRTRQYTLASLIDFLTASAVGGAIIHHCAVGWEFQQGGKRVSLSVTGDIIFFLLGWVAGGVALFTWRSLRRPPTVRQGCESRKHALIGLLQSIVVGAAGAILAIAFLRATFFTVPAELYRLITTPK